MDTFIGNIIYTTIRIHYANSLNALVLLAFLNVIFFYLIRNLMVKKVKKKWRFLTKQISLLDLMKKAFLAWSVFYAFYAILIYCPVDDRTPDMIPLHALYKYVMNQDTSLMRYGMATFVLLLPVGLWLAENLKALRSSFLYKWAAIVTGLIAIYLEFSQYELELGKPSVDDIIFIVLGVVTGIFMRDAYEKAKHFKKMLIDIIKNEKRQQERDRLKEEQKAIEKAEKEAEEEAKRLEEEEAQRLAEEKKAIERKEMVEKWADTLRGSKVYAVLTTLIETIAIAFFDLAAKIALFFEKKKHELKERKQEKADDLLAGIAEEKLLNGEDEEKLFSEIEKDLKDIFDDDEV